MLKSKPESCCSVSKTHKRKVKRLHLSMTKAERKRFSSLKLPGFNWRSKGKKTKVIPIVGIIILLFVGSVWAESYTDNQIVEAIGRAENSVKYPYGIKSIDTHGDPVYARKICLNSVRNGRKRWIKAGKPCDLITFIGKRYCPPSAHSLNKNWVTNVRYYLKKGLNG